MKINTFFLRVAASCNLNCDYCYVFKHRDKSWEKMPAKIPEDVLARIRHLEEIEES